MSPADWSWNGEALVALGLAAGYLMGTRDARGGWRAASFLSGCALLLVALVTPLDTLARGYLVWGHLLQNVVLAEWAPLLLVLGLPRSLAARIAGLGVVRALTHPFVALPLWVGAYALWHVPLYTTPPCGIRTRCSRSNTRPTSRRGSSSGGACGSRAAPPRLGRARRVRLAAFVLSAPLGLVLALVPRPLYDFYAGAPERVWGLSRLTDQQLGGMTMAAEQSVVFFAVFAYWFLRFLSEQERLEEEANSARPIRTASCSACPMRRVSSAGPPRPAARRDDVARAALPRPGRGKTTARPGSSWPCTPSRSGSAHR